MNRDFTGEAYIESAQLYREGLSRLATLQELSALGGRTVCVVGCTGLIGKVLTSILVEANRTVLRDRKIQIFGIARNQPSDLSPIEPGVQFIQASVTDPNLNERLPECDYTIYVAGTTSDYLNRREQTIETQITGLERFLMRSAACRGFVYISSTRVYGRYAREEPITEEHQAHIMPMHLHNLYDSCKHLGESLCLWHALNRGVNVSVARLTNIYGPPASLHSETAVTDFIRQAYTRREISLRGSPASVRNQCCVLDAAQGIVKMLISSQPGEAYNIGSHEHLSTSDMAQRISDVFPYPVPVRLPSSSEEPSVQRISVAKAERDLSFAPNFTWMQVAPLVIAETISCLESATIMTS